MSAVEDYLAIRSEAERLAARVSAFARQINIFSDSLRLAPQNVIHQIPTEWMPREDLHRLLSEAVEVWRNMNSAYSVLPDDQKRHVSPPLLGMGR
jgi:hypothetical protein